MAKMTPEEHKQRHVELHRALDELLADWFTRLPVGQSVLNRTVHELITWSHRQTEGPDHEPSLNRGM